MLITEFDFELPENLIAQQALADRTASKLLVMDKESGQVNHAHVKNLPEFFKAGDLIVVNNSKVLPARLLGDLNGLAVECFLLSRHSDSEWTGLVKPGKKIEAGSVIVVQKDGRELRVEVIQKHEDGKVELKLSGDGEVNDLLQAVGHMPLPPYIKRADTLDDKTRYQTVYAKSLGSVAAPTAGLHFTPELIEQVKGKGVDFAEVTLHVGYGTFKPVRVEKVEDHVVDPEVYEIFEESAAKINQALQEGRRVIAVGTTTTRVLEFVANANQGKIVAGAGTADIFIYPGYEFKVLSGLMTNFHLPKSSLLVLVSAFAGKDKVLAAYNEAVKNEYRFYSYGDAMLIL